MTLAETNDVQAVPLDERDEGLKSIKHAVFKLAAMGAKVQSIGDVLSRFAYVANNGNASKTAREHKMHL